MGERCRLIVPSCMSGSEARLIADHRPCREAYPTGPLQPGPGLGAPGETARDCAAVTVSALKGAPGGGGISTSSPAPSRQAFGSVKTTLQREHWYSPVGRIAPAPSRAITRR
jgi:hypothetical protein